MNQIMRKFIDRSNNNGNDHQLQACREFKSSETSSEYKSAILQYQTHVFNL